MELNMSKFIVYLSCLLGILITNAAAGQVATSDSLSSSTKGKAKDGSTSVFLSSTWSSTFRSLETGDGFFGKPLGERVNETRLNAWSFTLGFRSQLSDYFAWEGAVAYMKNGESYAFEESDTSYSYESRYNYIGVPMKLFFTYGDEIKLLVGAGVVPQMFTGFKQNITYEDKLSNNETEEIKTKIGYNSFVLSTVFNLGAQFKVGERWSILLLPEYKLQLTSSYQKDGPYKHKANSIGGHIGLVFDL